MKQSDRFAFIRRRVSYLQDDEELVSRLSLHHDLLSILKLDRFQGVGDCQTLPLVERL